MRAHIHNDAELMGMTCLRKKIKIKWWLTYVTRLRRKMEKLKNPVCPNKKKKYIIYVFENG